MTKTVSRYIYIFRSDIRTLHKLREVPRANDELSWIFKLIYSDLLESLGENIFSCRLTCSGTCGNSSCCQNIRYTTLRRISPTCEVPHLYVFFANITFTCFYIFVKFILLLLCNAYTLRMKQMAFMCSMCVFVILVSLCVGYASCQCQCLSVSVSTENCWKSIVHVCV